MSVPSWRRNESSIQYLDTARELYEHTLRYTRKFPKSAMFFITKDVVEAAKDVFQNVLKANSIFIKTEGDLEHRRYLLNEALGGLSVLDAIVPIAKDLYAPQISDYGWVHWGELLSKESGLILGVMRSDLKAHPGNAE